MRVWFVGILFAIGVFLFLYKGFTNRENIALNFAGIFALGVAIFPMNHPLNADVTSSSSGSFSLHGFCAVSLFLCIAFVSVFCARATLKETRLDPSLRASYRRKYYILAVLMIVSPVIALALALLFRQFHKYTFYIETAGVWAFAAFWLTKSRELSRSGAEKEAVEGKFAPN